MSSMSFVKKILSRDIEPLSYIFFAATPFHLICINEIHKANPSKNFELILMLYKQNNFANKQIYKTLKILGYEKYTVLHLNYNPVVNYFMNLIFIRKLLKRTHSNNLTITMIDFRNSFMHSLRLFFKDAKFILIDDGFQTYSAYEKYIKYGYYITYDRYLNSNGLILRWIYFGQEYKYLLRKKIDIFSIYVKDFDLYEKSFFYNDLSHLKKFISVNSCKNLDANEVFFIGGKASERGAMSLNDELFYVDWLNSYWKSKGKTMTYIAKRSSSEEKLMLIKKIGINVLRFDLPLEMALIYEKTLPGVICSTGSTLLKTLPMLYDGIQFFMIDISSFYKNFSDKEEAKFSQKFCENKNIKNLCISKV
jgi:hypothetical protein